MAAADQLKKDGNRIDPASQKILWRLRNPWHDRDWVRGSYLRRAAELSQNRQVYYRIEKYLEPAGLVEEKARRREDDPRAFRLTEAGEHWVDAHEERLKAPVGRIETQQMAREAMDETEAAKESVRNYRKKLHRVKSTVDDLKDQTREQTDRLDEVADRVVEVNNTVVGHGFDIRDLQNSKADEQESRERLRAAKQDLEDENQRLTEKIETLEGAVKDAQDSLEALRAENTALRERLDAIENELGKSWTEKIRRQ